MNETNGSAVDTRSNKEALLGVMRRTPAKNPSAMGKELETLAQMNKRSGPLCNPKEGFDATVGCLLPKTEDLVRLACRDTTGRPQVPMDSATTQPVSPAPGTHDAKIHHNP